jgi:hypothetical protein
MINIYNYIINQLKKSLLIYNKKMENYEMLDAFMFVIQMLNKEIDFYENSLNRTISLEVCKNNQERFLNFLLFLNSFLIDYIS